MATEDAIEAALKQAAEGTKPEPATTGQESETGTPERTPAEAFTEPQKTGKEQEPGPIPYSRFTEVNEERKELKERLQKIEEKLDQKDADLRTLQQRYEESEGLVESIRNLYADERYRPHVVAIDKALQGIEEEVESEEITREEGDRKIEQTLQQHESKVQDMLAEQRAEMLLQHVQQRASEFLNNLPEAYTDKDKEVLSNLWGNWVDWDAIEEKPDSMVAELSGSLQKLLDWYGDPRGAVAQKTEEETEEKPPPGPTPEDQVRRLSETNWGALDDKGNPKVDEGTFAKILAKRLELSKQGF